MKKRFLAVLFLGAMSLVSCRKENDKNNNTPTTALADVAVGNWNLIEVKRTQDGVIQGAPFYLEYEILTLAGSLDINDSSNTASFDYNYRGSAADNTIYSSGNKSYVGSYEIIGQKLNININDSVVYDLEAIEVGQNRLKLRHIEIIDVPGASILETITEDFVVERN